MDPVPTTGVNTLHPNSEKKETPQIVYSPEAMKYINFRRQRIIAARDTRDMSHDEFDGMGFLMYHDTMKKADDQYVAPRKNKQDTSLNLGTIRDKDTSLLEYAMKYDFEPVAQVYDDSDEMLIELAETGEDMVRKSKQLETYRDKAKLIYRSMIAFGTALVEDVWVERWILEKSLTNGYKVGMGSDQAKWTEKLVKTYDGCQAKLWDLRKCYFGDIRKFFMNGPQGQPYFFTVEYESYDATKQIFGNWDRWNYVPTYITVTSELTQAAQYSSYWTLRPISPNYCEIIRYYDPIANEFSITINGVDMLPIMETKIKAEDGSEKTLVSGFPLSEVSPSGGIPFAKFDLEPMHDFAYSKPQPAKMRVMADVENMFMKLFIGMMKQKAKPTMGNKSGRMFGEEVTDPATVINDIREGDLFPVLPNFQGAQPADFSFFELVKKELDKNSVERSFQGMGNGDSRSNPADETATKDINDRKAQSLKVAAMFDGIISGENQLNWLRTYNIIKNWTKPIDKQIDVLKKSLTDVYRTVNVPAEIDGGQKATKKIVFHKDTTMTSEDIHQKEMDIKSGRAIGDSHQGRKIDKLHPVLDGIAHDGNETRLAILNPEKLKAIRLNWFYTCVPMANDSDPLAYMMFAKQISDAQGFFGPESMNVKKLKYRFAKITGNDFDTWFISEQELQQKQAAAQQAQMDGGDGSDTELGGGAGDATPTIASASRGSKPALKIGAAMR